jgi:hypothetical protein
MEELDEEYGGEDGLLGDDARTDKGKLTAKSVKDRLKAVKHDPDAADERRVLEQFLALTEQEAVANKKVKDAQKALDAKVAAKLAFVRRSVSRSSQEKMSASTMDLLYLKSQKLKKSTCIMYSQK